MKKKKSRILIVVDDAAWLEAKDRCIMINAADVRYRKILFLQDLQIKKI